MENSFLEQYYNLYDEDGRLASKYGKVEFITTMKYIHDYVKREQKFLRLEREPEDILLHCHVKAIRCRQWN